MCAKRFPSGSGPTQRQLRVGEVIRHRLAEVLMRGEAHDADLARLSITVTEVRVTTDLRYATAFVMPLGGIDTELALTALRRSTATLRHLVVKGLELKFAPELKFELDDTFDRMEHSRRLFSDPRVQADIAAPDTAPDDAPAVTRPLDQDDEA